MKVSRITVGDPEKSDPSVKTFRIRFLGTDDLFQGRRPEDILAPFIGSPLFRPTSYGAGDEGRIKALSADVGTLAAFWKENSFLDLEKEAHEFSYQAMFQNVIPARNPRLQSIFSTLGIWITVPKQRSDAEFLPELRKFAIDLCFAFRPCYGCCYQQIGSSILWRLRKAGIPDIFWINFFGSPYIESFGMDKLKSTPHAIVEMLDGVVMIETRDITSGQREIVKKHLGRRFFVGGGALFQGVKIPRFNFPAPKSGQS